jgi:hypothetical protein
MPTDFAIRCGEAARAAAAGRSALADGMSTNSPSCTVFSTIWPSTW